MVYASPSIHQSINIYCTICNWYMVGRCIRSSLNRSVFPKHCVSHCMKYDKSSPWLYWSPLGRHLLGNQALTQPSQALLLTENITYSVCLSVCPKNIWAPQDHLSVSLSVLTQSVCLLVAHTIHLSASFSVLFKTYTVHLSVCPSVPRTPSDHHINLCFLIPRDVTLEAELCISGH